ncbi:MAG: type II/IV secretion system ATPase subunit [Thermoplasmata archaeon]|nr:MAG: type II/IV secretion system ATPase subunit [Thermoplasmata archaeon]
MASVAMELRKARADLESLLKYGKSLQLKINNYNKTFSSTNLSRGFKRVLAKSRWIRPNFAQCWIIPKPPASANLCKTYKVNGTPVKLYELPDGAESLYHIEPPEYNLTKKQCELIDHVKSELMDHIPTGLNVRHPKKVIEYIENFGQRTISSYLQSHEMSLGRTRTEENRAVLELTRLVAKYTVGFGLIEVLLEDKYVQDIYVDAPVENNHIYLSMGSIDDSRLSSKFKTNIILTNDAAESLMSRFRYESGRPFSEAHPLLECDNETFNTRVTIIGSPVSPRGMAFALRRHSPDPWTLPRLVQAKSITALAAGLLSFLIDGQSTMLIAGGRGAGKSSLLGAIMFEFAPVQRILTIEDTLELPGPEMQELGYKLQTMHIQSSVRGEGSMTADEALRISLRLGESAIVLGEVRGEEARTLYEAMRAGTAGSAVLGTFHADSARTVFERVVYDMGITAEAFSSTDIVIVAGLTRPAGIHRQHRRVIQVAELVKGAEQPGTFSDLLRYDAACDALVETEAFLESSERLGAVARSWGITYPEVLGNIRTRAALKQLMVDYANSSGNGKVLSGKWVYRCNSVFWEMLARQHSKEHTVDYKKLLKDWKKWFAKAVVNES